MDKLELGYAALSAARAILTDGGGTFDARTFEPIPAATTGYVVGLVNGTAAKLSGDVGAWDVATLLRDVVAAHPRAPYIGGWVDNGTVHIDPVIILQSLVDALALAAAFNQYAVYDIVAGESVTP